MLHGHLILSIVKKENTQLIKYVFLVIHTQLSEPDFYSNHHTSTSYRLKQGKES
jgi:hypothetical protein